jgi:hypothetical protein
MSTSQEREAERYQEEIEEKRNQEIARQQAARAAEEPLLARQRASLERDLDLKEKYDRGEGEVFQSTLDDFEAGRKRIDELAHKNGTYGSTEHRNKKIAYEKMVANLKNEIKMGRQTNLNTSIFNQNTALQGQLRNRQTSSQNIMAAIGARPATTRGWARSNLDKFTGGVAGSIGGGVGNVASNIGGSIGRHIFGTPSRTVAAGLTTIPAKQGWLSKTFLGAWPKKKTP